MYPNFTFTPANGTRPQDGQIVAVCDNCKRALETVKRIGDKHKCPFCGGSVKLAKKMVTQ